jgi:N-acetylglucosamine kinase-like BadF-type ATPase
VDLPAGLVPGAGAGAGLGAELVVGLDVGGTKLAIRAETLAGASVADVTMAAAGWSATPAAEAGSALAVAVIEAAAAELDGLAGRLQARGAVGTVVVAGGSVVTRQPLLARFLAEQLRLVSSDLSLRVLEEEPVAGAVVLARRLLESTHPRGM